MPSSPAGPRQPARRAVLLGGLLAGAALGAGACGAPQPPAPERTGRSVAGAVRIADSPSYVVLPGELETACKQTAASYVQAVLTAGTPTAAALPLGGRLRALRQPVEPAAPLLGLLPADGSSSLQVVYPQYSGLTSPRADAGVVLVAEQLLLPSGADATQVERRGITVDVRLRLLEGVWTVVEALPGVPPPAARVSAAVQRVLDDPRIVLPAAARADLAAGTVPDVVATVLSQLSPVAKMDVQVIRTGHPGDVFSPGRSTGHAQGLAVDIRALDDLPVIDRGRSPWPDFMKAAAALDTTEVGGPENVGRGTFKDEVHQDHVHLGFAPLPV